MWGPKEGRDRSIKENSQRPSCIRIPVEISRVSVICPVWDSPPPKHQHLPVGAKQQGVLVGISTQVCPFLLPPAPPRLQLVAGPGGLRCAGVVEFYSGSLGGTVLYEGQDRPQDLENLICSALQCGSFLKHLPQTEAARAPGPPEPTGGTDSAGVVEGRSPLPIRWKIQDSSCASLPQCFRKTQPQEGGQELALVCSGQWDWAMPHGASCFPRAGHGQMVGSTAHNP